MMRLTAMCSLLLLAGCGGFGQAKQSVGPTLADLEPVALERGGAQVPRLALSQLAAIYRDVLAHQQDPKTRLEIQHRLADLEMLSGEAELADAIDQNRLFAPAIEAYERLLLENPDYERRDTVLYQLSKAYDLRGDTQRSARVLNTLREGSSESPYLAEASFRLAEQHFAYAEYSAAEVTYRQVVGFGPDTAFYARALYMLGWSHFKQGAFYEAIAPFTASLDEALQIDGQKQHRVTHAVSNLPRARRELVEDSLRVLALVFSNLGGAETIAQTAVELGERPYQHRFYEALGELYLSQERYDDSADVYKAYRVRYPDSALAHRFGLRVIEAYERGGFPDLILAGKQDYVAAFAVNSHYWEQSAEPERDAISAALKLYLQELASHFHARAQARQQSPANTSVESSRDYATAAGYYREFIASFPEDPDLGDTRFLLAESLYEAGDYQQAIVAYEAMAYQHSTHEKAADAAYMGILSHRELAPQATVDSQEAIASKLRFAQHFSQDERAAPVLADVARQLLARGEYASAIAAARQLVAREAGAEAELQLAGYLVIGHSEFAREQYAAAEAAYARALPLIGAADARRAATAQRISAALYRQAQQQRERQEHLAAARLFDRAVAAAPASEVAISARYDAAAAYQSAGELAKASSLLEEFRRLYPEHTLSAGIGVQLVTNYEALEDWGSAAAELDVLSTTLDEPGARAEALIVAAQYYDQLDDSGSAIERYRRYAHEWPSPVATRMEAMQRLTVLYTEQALTDKADFWRLKLEEAHRDAGAEQSQRSAFLAAKACAALADSAFTEFQSITLSHPIKRSLRKKQAAMQHSLQAYTRCSSYGVEQVTTLASYRIGSTYEALSAALMTSEKPQALDALALEQYDMMLEEQAFPFEEKAIAVHESNVARCAQQGVYDEWVRASFVALESLVPARYRKREVIALNTDVQPEHTRNRGKRKKLLTLNEAAIASREQGDFEQARDYYRRALKIADDDAITHHNLGILLDLYMGEPAAALEHYQRYQALTQNLDRTVAGWIALLQRRTVSLAGGA